MLIAGPNLTIDRTSSIAELRPGEVLRVGRRGVTPGGKGLNVARAARALGAPAASSRFVPGHTGHAAAELIADEGRRVDAACPSAARSARPSIILEPGGRATVINEPGPALADGDWERLGGVRSDEALPATRVLVCSGSLPPGSPDDGYARLVARAPRLAPIVVDAGGAALGAALDAGPAVVTPNLAEAEGLLHGRADEAVETSPDARGHARGGRRGARAAPAHARRWSPRPRRARRSRPTGP